MDGDQSGTLDRHEIVTALASLGVSAEDAHAAAEAMDLDHDGQVSYSEFITACLSLRGEHLQPLVRQAFMAIDVDRSGRLSREELRGLLCCGCAGGRPVEEPEVDELFAQMDQDGDGSITFEEFQVYMTS